jgi:hypothetical protein
MIGARLGVVVCLLTGLVAALAWAQSPIPGAKPLTVAALQARVKTLEDDNAGLRRDYELILTTCQNEAAKAVDERPRPEDDRSDVVSVDYEIVESNKIFTSYGWTLTLSNGLDRAQAFDVTLQFLDRNGSVIDTDREDNETIDAYAQRTLTGSHAISMPGALNVASMRAVAKRTR